MKNLQIVLLVFTFGISFYGHTQESTKMQGVVATHDVLMAKMPDLVKLINQLQPKVDSTNTGQKHQKAINALKASNKSMMTWMQGFGERFTADEMMKGKELSTQKKAWLDEESLKVKALQEEIDSSIGHARRLLEKGI